MDIILLILTPIVSILISLIFKANLLISTLLFFGLPGLYLSCRNPKNISKALLFSCLISFTIGITLDHIGALNQVWVTTNSISSVRFFGTLPLENPLWVFLYVYLIIMFYEHFFSKGKRSKNTKKPYFVCALVIISLLLLSASFVFPDTVSHIPYPYLLAGIFVFAIPSVLFLYKFPKFISSFEVCVLYFTFLSLLDELVALKLHHWTFPGGQVIGYVTLFGLRFPYEELFFFILFGSIGILTYYKFFFDNKK